ncbi:SGNH hydrolase domain-containing protein [Nocardioides sp. C4-1]|uniref:SGNH hydrolase domain-containing protein n=1 Tax=Nocardioides sp. C4-1 TaxID=3151851 RepID=UPI0032664070
MRSPGPEPRARAARRVPLLAWALALAVTLSGVLASPVASAGVDDTGGRLHEVVPLGEPVVLHTRTAPSARTVHSGPDFPDLPTSCYTTDPYALTPEPCRLTPRLKGAPLIVLWGDSHAWMMTPAIRKAVHGKRVNVIALMQGACPVMYSDLSTPKKRASRNGCDVFGHEAISFIRKAKRQKRPLRVIVAMAWELYHNVTDEPNGADRKFPGFANDYIRVNAVKSLRGTPRAFRELGRMGVRTDIVAASPMVYQTAPECPGRGQGWRCPLPRAGVLKDPRENNAQVRRMRSLLSVKGSIIRPATSLCGATTCRGTIDGVPTYYDRIHLGQRASYRLSSHFRPTVRAVVDEAKNRPRAAR